MDQYIEERKNGKMIRDCVWKDTYIRLHPISVAVLDTPEFQRLRKLHQLGCTQYVYPGAEHSRLIHSLGVAHLAHRCGSHLCRNQASLPLDPTDLLSLELGGKPW
jgi:HD superfamily phosphohydrolase